MAAESPFIFLKGIHGTEIGKSPYDEKGAIAVKEIMAKDAEKGVPISITADCDDDVLPRLQVPQEAAGFVTWREPAIS